MGRKVVEFLTSGKGINKIYKELHVGKRRVRQLRDQARVMWYLGEGLPLLCFSEALFPEEALREPMPATSVVDEQISQYHEQIKDRLQLGWRPITAFEGLPIRVERSSFYRYLE